MEFGLNGTSFFNFTRINLAMTTYTLKTVALTLLAFLACIPSVHAQTWEPAKNVEIVVYAAPGGSNDKTARAIEKAVGSKKLINTTMTVVNKTGGGGNIQLNYMTQHAGDAHYLMITTPTLLANHITGSSTQNHKDFSPIASMINDFSVFAVNADSALKTGKDVVDKLKANPRSLSIGFAGAIGGHNHVAAGLLMKGIGGEAKALKVIAFKGSSEALTALMGGHIDMVVTAAGNVSSHMAAGKLRAVGVASSQRLSGDFSKIPTWKEQGVDVVWGNWRAVMGPKGMTPAQIARWEGVLRQVVQTPDWKADLENNFWTNDFTVGNAFKQDLEKDYVAMRTVLVELGLAK
jgi:putative tricarboxylic transport membrane protein